MDQIRRGNYDSGQDYVLEYGDLRFTFNERDFSERVEQAARKLGFVGRPLEDTELEDLVNLTVNGEVVITPNGQIVQATNLSRDWARAVVDIPVPTTLDVNRVNEILREVGREAFRDPGLRPLLLDPPSVMGVESLDLEQVNVRMVARTLPGKQFEVGRDLRARIVLAFGRQGLSVQPPPVSVDQATSDEAVPTAAPEGDR